VVYKFGRLPVKFNKKTLDGARLFRGILPAAPPKIWREFKVPANAWGMYGNDVAGDCTIASKAHQIMMMTAHTGKMVIPDPAAIIAAYTALTGYDPATGANDTGCAMTDVLEYWQTTGIAGHKILAWAQIDQTDIEQVKLALYLFGAVDIGVNLPNSAMTQFQNGQAFAVLPDDGGIAGGHDVPIFGEGSIGASCVTWAQRQELTWEWFSKYCEESYVVITQDWLNAVTGLAPNLLNLAALQADLAALKA
jgi:hypothetical protein